MAIAPAWQPRVAARSFPVAALKAAKSYPPNMTACPIGTLKKRAEFLAAASSGKKWVVRNVIMQIGKPSSDNQVRFGLTASGKIGNAVVRNRARRRLRALAHEIISAHALPADYVLIARKDTPTCKYSDLRQDLINGLKRLKAWKE